MKYKILTDDCAASLARRVNEHLKDGWVPTGGVAVAQSDFHSTDHQEIPKDNFKIIFAQAIVNT